MDKANGGKESQDGAGERDQRGIQSVEVGGRLLRALAHHGRAMPLKALAADAGMAAGKAHPYLVSFGKIGLVEQDRATGHYGLGPLALQLGLMSLQQSDPLRVCTPLIADLAVRSGHTVGIAVWGSRGPTVVRLEESPAPVHVTLRHGTVFSIADTASGRLFAAHRPAAEVRPLYEQERKLARHALPAWAEFEKSLETERRHGLSRVEGAVVAGISALSAPVFVHTGEMRLALIAIGPSAAFDVRWNGPLAQDLLATARGASARLGHRG
jgi:DNA-binding IclR family transcriptional regulator